jgi:hypothetical protein
MRTRGISFFFAFCVADHVMTIPSFSSTLVARIKEICNFPSASESERIISGLRWIGLFSSEPVKARAGNLLDTLCAQLESLMKYEQGERDLVMLQHKFVVEWADGTEVWKSFYVLWNHGCLISAYVLSL